jgi:formylglycine-generating enzyme required for sulfatase activity
VAVVGRQSTAPVGGLLPSTAGALDLSGNLWEWQQDRWSDAPATGVDAEGPASGPYRVSRGGSWRGFPECARVADRRSDSPGYRFYILGVRLLRAAP